MEGKMRGEIFKISGFAISVHCDCGQGIIAPLLGNRLEFIT